MKVSRIAKPYGPIGDDLAITAEHAEVGTFNLSPLSAALHIEPESVEVGLGATEWDRITLHGGWKNQLNADELHLSFGPLELGPLLAKSGLNIDDKSLLAASIYGGLSVLVPRDVRGAYQGQWALDIKGFVPPHPPELQGFPFGDATRLESAFEVEQGAHVRNLHERAFDIRRVQTEWECRGARQFTLDLTYSGRAQGTYPLHSPCGRGSRVQVGQSVWQLGRTTR